MVEGAALEMLCRGNSTVGSNPTLSAILLFSRALLRLSGRRCSVMHLSALPRASSAKTQNHSTITSKIILALGDDVWMRLASLAQ